MKKLRALGLLLVLLGLQACIGTAFVAGATAGGFVVYDRRDLNTFQMDQQIRHQILLKLTSDPAFEHSHLAVSSFNRMVLLTGQTPSATLRVKAEKLARTIPGSRRIYNEIQIAKPTSAITRTKDTWITTKIRTEMLATPKLKSGQIKVVTEDGVVFLIGQLTPTQAHLAVRVARQTSGVRRVVKVFQYQQ